MQEHIELNLPTITALIGVVAGVVGVLCFRSVREMFKCQDDIGLPHPDFINIPPPPKVKIKRKLPDDFCASVVSSDHYVVSIERDVRDTFRISLRSKITGNNQIIYGIDSNLLIELVRIFNEKIITQNEPV